LQVAKDAAINAVPGDFYMPSKPSGQHVEQVVIAEALSFLH
jgi:hypothetical protein